MKKIAILLVMLLSAPSFADISLPAPQTKGGTPVNEAINYRASATGGNFPSNNLELSELSQILWSATGLNRDGRGWTVPLAKGKSPYCRIYAALESGTFLYDWEGHKLVEVLSKDIRSGTMLQDFAKTAPCILLFVMDAQLLSDMPEKAEFLAAIASGSMSQNIYLSAESLNIGVRYLMSINSELITNELGLPKSDVPICAVILGKYAG